MCSPRTLQEVSWICRETGETVPSERLLQALFRVFRDHERDDWQDEQHEPRCQFCPDADPEEWYTANDDAF